MPRPMLLNVKICNFFKIPEQLYDAAFMQVVGESTPKILGNDTN